MLIYDIEIRNAIPDGDSAPLPGITYCEGWTDYRGMGIGVIGCWDYAADRPRIFCSDNLEEFGKLIASHDCVVGFNNHRFDDQILAAHGCELPHAKSYDILQEVWRSLGERRMGYSLSALCYANFRVSKDTGGALAPVQWQQGQVGTVVDYCLKDIHLTKRLLDRIIRKGTLIDPHNCERRLPIRRPGAQV